MSWQCVLAAQKAKHTLDSMATRMREVAVSLCPALVRPHLECCVPVWSPQHRKDINLLEQIHRRTIKMIRCMEMLRIGVAWRGEDLGRFFCSILTYKEGL